MTQIRAAVCREFGQPLTIETLTLAAPGPAEVQVRIEACAICHSDISYADGGWGGHLPAVYGHEGVGRVTAVGAFDVAAQLGDRTHHLLKTRRIPRRRPAMHRHPDRLPLARLEDHFAIDVRAATGQSTCKQRLPGHDQIRRQAGK